jgi:hypothetical protein
MGEVACLRSMRVGTALRDLPRLLRAGRHRRYVRHTRLDEPVAAINAVGVAIIFIAAVLPVATIPLWQRRRARLVLLALCWVIAVGCVMHALVDDIARILSLADMLHMGFPFFASIDRRASDLQDLLLNEPWFLVEGLLWGVLGWFGLASARSSRLWVGSGVVATVALTVIGVLSTVGIIGRFIVG